VKKTGLITKKKINGTGFSLTGRAGRMNDTGFSLTHSGGKMNGIAFSQTGMAPVSNLAHA
jgi:hypothetical protein